jgi:hypothetical protein
MMKIVSIVTVMVVLTMGFVNPSFAEWDSSFDHDGDGVIALGDFALLAAHWLETEPSVPGPDITWVYIDDDGSGMVDGNGNPINEGGFTGYMSKYETTNAQ